jgi:transcriptional regulator with XRE-family HTH domain
MDKKNFGQLVASLRKESRNEFDEVMTQYDLAELARIPLITLQKIEQGRQVNIKTDMLLNLAESLHLSSCARQVFLRASLGIREVQTIRPVAAPQDVLAELTQTLSHLQTPAYIQDDFGDIVTLNPVSLSVLGLEVNLLHAPHLLSQYNINRFLFSPEFANLQNFLGQAQSGQAQRAVMLYKLWTMKVRHHWYFQRLLPELNRFPLFRRYWQSPNSLDEDIYDQTNFLNLKHPEFDLLKFLACPIQTITRQGNLNLFSLQPLDDHSAEACLQLVRKHGVQAIPLAPWPKPSSPNGLVKS